MSIRGWDAEVNKPSLILNKRSNSDMTILFFEHKKASKPAFTMFAIPMFTNQVFVPVNIPLFGTSPLQY